ncbi:MAG: hypothetical protein GY832_32105 [Chloroflexi bacterium]|nr:hypothetical protein [Chloroflexota bacterium]
MTKQRQQAIDPAVAALMSLAEQKKIDRGAAVPRKKVTLNLPINLVNAIRQEAFTLTKHKRRGFSDFVIVLLQFAWDAYRAGDLEIELQPAAVEMRITAVKK